MCRRRIPKEVEQIEPGHVALIRWSKAAYVSMYIGLFLTAFTAFFPFLVAVGLLVDGALIVVLTLATVGLIWFAAEDPGSNILIVIWQWLSGLLDKSINLYKFVPYAGCFYVICLVASIWLNAVGTKKGYHTAKTRMIYSIAIPVIIIVVAAAIVLYASYGK